MADVGRERGQLVLVTGLVVAVTAVALVLLLNTAIFTENLASRGTDVSGREAVEYRNVVSDGVADLVDAENEAEFGSWSPLRSNVESGMEQIDNFTSQNAGLGGTIAQINHSTATFEEGRLIRQPTSRSMENASGTDGDWTLATSVDGTRAFAMTVEESSLRSTTAAQADADGAFAVHVDGTADWWAFVYTDGGDVTVATSTGGTPAEVCSASAATATIDFTAGTINGQECGGLAWGEGVSAGYDLAFEHGGNATGTYNLTVDTTAVDTDNLNDGGPAPYHVPAVYSVEFGLVYESPTVLYRTEVRVAPGEPE